jgi:pimeloyl-ACP methyl ester carboxylesterase
MRPTRTAFSRLLLALTLVIVAGFGALLVAYRAPDRSVEELSARWAAPPSRFLAVEGMQVHLRDQGPREDPLPLVLLHGTSASLHTWDGWTEALREERRVIRFDLPAFGLTGPSPVADYRIESYARVLVGVLDSLGVERAVLAGNSLGGYVAWATALLHPERVERLVLVDAAGLPSESASVPLGFRIARTPLLGTLMESVLPRAMVESSVRNVYGDPERVTPELVNRYFELTTRAGNRRALRERFEQTRPGPLADRLHEVRVPTLILWGGRDRLIPPEVGERFHALIHGSELVRFEELGHVPQEEDPARTVAAVREFLSR